MQRKFLPYSLFSKPYRNSNFSRKIAPDFSIDINKGGFDLHFGVEKPDFDGFLQTLQVLENGLVLAVNIS